MDLRELRPPVGDGSFQPSDYLPPVTSARVAGARSYTGLTYAFVRGYRPLVLDLHVPAGAEGPVPVVVWIHGGGFTSGHGGQCCGLFRLRPDRPRDGLGHHRIDRVVRAHHHGRARPGGARKHAGDPAVFYRSGRQLR